ncbi:MAG TPA: PhzF family phenazine biosynthesis protein [Anaerolineaceae bacterium]|nr:PhzF family phenazine biosynthesis protein [Anaerolineaceae bacterium]
MTKLFQVDAFTDRVFSGNPAAVCLLEDEKADTWMQALATEMNLSETAFLTKQEDGYGLRWFTPATEVKLCGHATLASAWVLFTEKIVSTDQVIHFHTLSGLLAARWENGSVALDFPAFRGAKSIEKPALMKALGVKQGALWQAGPHQFVELESAETLRRLAPDFDRMVALGNGDLAVTCRSDDPAYDFISRFFAPALGVNEDPVTGSAHCSLGPFWMERLGKDRLRAFQASTRGGSLLVNVLGDRVELHGKAVTVFQAELKD